MRWQGRRQSGNIEDRRGDGGGLGGGMGGPRMPMGFPTRRAGAGGLGIGAIIVILVIAWITGINPLMLLGGLDGGGGPVVIDQGGGRTPGGQTTGEQGTPADEGGQFVAAVLGDTEDTWRAIFQKGGATYQDPTLVLFSGATESACGFASAASGPFYCPRDRKVYIDLAFYSELRDRFKAPGDFAQAYVIAHEIGHHVQNLLGDLGQVEQMKQQVGEAERNQLSVRVELQADCYAGIWANDADRRGVLEVGDIDEGLNAAAQIGDDAIQQRTRGYVVPESFNHGTSEQRARWFKRGYETGSMANCDTLSASQL
jgi:predicted metalloprotease